MAKHVVWSREYGHDGEAVLGAFDTVTIAKTKITEPCRGDHEYLRVFDGTRKIEGHRRSYRGTDDEKKWQRVTGGPLAKKSRHVAP